MVHLRAGQEGACGMNSRDALHVTFVQASALGIRCEQARDPAVTGGRVMVAVRRSFPSPRVQGVICALDVSPHNCAGSLTGAGGFFVPSREDRASDPAVIARSGVAAPVVKFAVPVCTLTSFAKESDR